MGDGDFVACESCGKEVGSTLTWCPFCGAELGSQARPLPKPAELPEPEWEAAEATVEVDWSEPEEPPDAPTCPGCERDVDHGLTWCPFCGTELNADETPPGPVSEPEEVLPPPPLEDPDEAWGPAESPEGPPPRPARTGPLGVEDQRPGPDLETEQRRVKQRQTAGTILSIILILGSVAFVVAIFTVLRSSGESSSETPSATTGDGPQEVFTAFDPEPRQCLSYRNDGEIAQTDCGARHDGEVFATAPYSPSTDVYPGREALSVFASDSCFGQFPAYVGVDFYASGLTFSTITPNAAGWEDGDRTIVCVLEDPLGEPLEGSMRNSGGLIHEGYVPYKLLPAGTCWNFTDDTGELVPIVPCAEPHDAETFANFTYPGSTFAGAEAAFEVGGVECGRRFEEYTGGPPAEGIDYWAGTPDEFSWQHGFDVVVCTLFRIDEAPMTGSARG